MKKLFSLIFVCALLFVAGNVQVSADSRSDYESYVSSYKAYRNAVSEKGPVGEILELHKAYQAAKATYEGSLNRANSSETVSSETTSTSSSASSGDKTENYLTGSEGTIASSTAEQLPVGLKRILSQLWSENGRKNPDQAMKLLASFAESSANAKFADIARYELAKAYELLKDDVKSATTILSQIGRNNPNSKMALLAKERMNYLAAGQKHLQWKNALNGTYGVSQESYQKYRNTSWLAFPVKVTRWFGYAGKLLNFNNTQSDFEKFQVWYEEMGSKFAPAVDITFDKFKVANGTSSETSDVSLCYSNSKAWYSRWKTMNDARQSIDIQYFIMDKDIFGYSMLGVLLKKAKEGLKIRLLLDARGTKKLTRKLLGQDLLQELTEYPNVEVKVFNPVHTNLLTVFTDPRKLFASNHDKIIVVDGEISIVGGRNVSMDYFLEPEDHAGAYRDCDVVVKSAEIAQQLDYAFDEEFSKIKTYNISKELWGNIDIMSDQLNAAYDTMYSHLLNERLNIRDDANAKYRKAAGEFLQEISAYNHLREFSGFDPFASSVEAPAKIVDKHSLGGPRNDITDEMIKYIDGCKREVLLQNPYVVLTDRMFNALKRAGKRGVPIIMHTNSPASTDSLATQAMFYADWKRIFKEIPNIRIYVYKGSNKLHAKNWVFDQKIGVVGTYNLDYLSEQVNSEVVIAVKSDEFAKELRDGILSDVNKSEQYQFKFNDKGEVESTFGPDDLQGKNFWLLKTLSKFTIFKKLI
ncbi:MAG: phosphatidylserine/phosphatidylglycerophosphate/cardiolipin synthase family protein [Erysipelotrichia bacterium]|nr:phosphatidylserine/phosphatidylglycerophosphate/cardiolipin synthase family protein [Erysipelotrichia bacterium]